MPTKEEEGKASPSSTSCTYLLNLLNYLQCDQKSPSCSQCIRARCLCVGYRDVSQLYICNDTESVVKRLCGKVVSTSPNKSKSHHSVNNGPRHIHTDAGNNAWECLMSINWGDALTLFSLPINTEEVALHFYMVTHAPTAVFSYIPTFWSAFSTNSPAKLAISTVALASWAKEFRRPDIIELARRKYGKTLAQVNLALSDPQLAVLDSTLLSCLLLSTFEALLFSGRKTPHNWMAHVRGCSTLLCLRGKRQFDSELGRELFNHASSIIRTSLYFDTLPDGFTHLTRHANESLGYYDPRARMGTMLDRLAALKGALKGMKASAVVQEALYLDGECLTLINGPEKLAPYTIRYAAEYPVQPQTYQGIIHVYSDQGIARWCNVLRVIRLTLNDWIFCAFRERCGIVSNNPAPDDLLPNHWNTLPTTTVRNIEAIISDIFASVPFSLDLLYESMHSPSTPARFLIWPLATVGTTDLCPPSAKTFAVERLNALGKIRGLQQAALAAQMLTAGDPLEDW